MKYHTQKQTTKTHIPFRHTVQRTSVGGHREGGDSQMKTMEYSLSRLGLIMTETNVISLPIGVSLWTKSRKNAKFVVFVIFVKIVKSQVTQAL